jgi:hypothetical protein
MPWPSDEYARDLAHEESANRLFWKLKRCTCKEPRIENKASYETVDTRYKAFRCLNPGCEGYYKWDSF